MRTSSLRWTAVGAVAVAATAVGCTTNTTNITVVANPPAFNRAAGAVALGLVKVSECRSPDGPTGSGHLKITFDPSGTVLLAVIDQPPFMGTAVGECIADKFRGVRVPPFAGPAVAVGKSFVVE
ncbi:MAG: hypothetical protein ACLQVI_02650 [Polyangiaceae bacterium]